MVEKLLAEIKTAMKAKNTMRLLTLRTVMSEAKNIAITNKRKDITTDDLITAVTKGIKQRQESYDEYINHGHPERANVERYEMDVLKEFQPKQLSEDELVKIVDEMILTYGASSKKDMGKVMSGIMGKIDKGSADGKLLSKIVGNKLS